LNLRASPSTSAAIVTAIPEGATVTDQGSALQNHDGHAWRHVDYRGHDGWVANEYLHATCNQSPPPPPPGGSGGGRYPLYKQCDGRWAHNTLGTAWGTTVCDAGCAMSSLSMVISGHGGRINGQEVNPGTLNSWLTAHGGYAAGDELYWGSANSLSSVKFSNMYHGGGSLSATSLRSLVSGGHPVIVNVRGGTHWVLVTGGGADGHTFEVNDPGFNTGSYDYSGMCNFAVYNA